ncbi:DUF6089 family protein [Flammeovirga aprica]|uniref:DUF6089 domain-containing protein n=1 Tax=Flammeovirga aprica JL-4 TaxID=694437 RepID=A0A7X9P3I1_9BACT|nr:DUF6089 family protein [Flammeovirga aprica]NME68377.1 hypothetical protein [Flammeovirga aprica JL-4]
MNKELKYFLISCFFVTITLISNHKANAQYWVLSGGVGTAFYSGDVSPVPHPSDFRVGGKFSANYKIKNHFLWRTSLDLGWYTGNDAHYDKSFHQSRNASFENVMVNVATGFEYNFLNFREHKRKIDNFTPYFFMQLGVGAFPILNTTTTRADNIYYSVTLPLGIGFKKRITYYLDFGMEFSIVKPLWNDNTDSIFRGDITAPDREQTVYPTWRDNYYFLGFTLSYHIFNINCPQYKDRR